MCKALARPRTKRDMPDLRKPLHTETTNRKQDPARSRSDVAVGGEQIREVVMRWWQVLRVGIRTRSFLNTQNVRALQKLLDL